MSLVRNSDTLKELREASQLQQASEPTPTALSQQVVAVMEVNPKLLRRANTVKSGTASNALTQTIFTTPTDFDFYITGACLSMIKDATSQSVISTISAFVNGANQRVLAISGITLTAQADTIYATFSPPLKVDRGTAITVTNSNLTANVRADASIIGYSVENVNG